MPKNLLIVESPAKAKTIEKILGKDFTVKSSYGHVRDLEKTTNAVNISDRFKPNYVISPEKHKVVRELKGWVKKVDHVWLATDEDREGEAISWHLCEVLDLDPAQTKRIVFREITAQAIKKAIESPRTLDINLVNAQQARRILDRLVGYELSEVLWRKVKGKLSAGRVQSVAVKLIVEREREILEFVPEGFYRVEACFPTENGYGKLVDLKASLDQRLEGHDQARAILDRAKGAHYRVADIEVKPVRRSPAPPFTTSTLQQEASRKLGFGVNRTMSVAQRLYEAGLISYMRTDSTNLSEVAISSIVEVVGQSYGPDYVQVRKNGKKRELAQEAHEAIRPTDFHVSAAGDDNDQRRLYDLIWKRTVASQMADARMERTVVKIKASTLPEHHFIATGEVLKFDGFLKVYLESHDDIDDEQNAVILPPLQVGQVLQLGQMSATERQTKPPARYTEAGLVKKLEELGIGRPSTYAPTISKIMEDERGYVTRESREGQEQQYKVLLLKDGQISEKTLAEKVGVVKNRLFATDIGMVVTDFLGEHFEQIMDYGFTAEIEEKFDHIAGGKFDWTAMLADFYFPFHKVVEGTMQNAKRSRGERELGVQPGTGLSVLAKISRFGKPMIQIGAIEELPEDQKPRFANLRAGQSISSISLEEALQLFELPRDLGEYAGKGISVNSARFGPYLKYGDDSISLGRKIDPFEVDYEQAVELIKEKQAADQPLGTYQGMPITKGKGRFGPFVKWNGMYVNIPRKYDPERITVDECIELIQAKATKEKGRYISQWPEDQLAVENGRWGPYIRYGKKNFKLLKGADGSKLAPEDVAALSREHVIAMIEEQAPGVFKAKKTKKSSGKT